MTRRKKTVVILLSIFLGLPLLLIAAALAIRGCDEPPPNDADLKVQRLQIPDDQNALTLFLEAVQKLDMPRFDTPLASQANQQTKEGEGPQNEHDLFYEIAVGKRWDGPFVDRVLKSNAEALALWEQGMAAPHFQAIEVKTLADRIPHVFEYLSFGNLVSVRARAAAKRGDYEAAFQDCMKLVRFGRRIEGDKGCLVEYLLGITVHGMGDGLMLDMVSGCNLPPAMLRHYAAELAKCPADAQGLADAFRNEYALQVEAIEGMKSGKYDASMLFVTSPGPSAPRSALDALFWNAFRVTSFRPQETRRTCAEVARSRIESVSKPFKHMAPEDPTIRDFRLGREAFSGNFLGRACCKMLLPAAYGAVEQKCRANVELAATRILLALKAYKLEKGKLPATLAELVPEYLDSVPLDDYDGLPMRYNAARKVVYSVGKNLANDGGSGTRAEHVAVKRKEAEAAGEKWTDEDQKGAEQQFNEWDQPDACFEIKF
jgi:hypothetical protein